VKKVFYTLLTLWFCQSSNKDKAALLGQKQELYLVHLCGKMGRNGNLFGGQCHFLKL
jgi:hypothetical protein